MASISYLSQTSATTGTSTYTFSGRSLGAAQADRQIIIAVSGRASGSAPQINSVSVAGIAATKLVAVRNVSTSVTDSSIWIADVPTGTTGDVVVNFSANYVRAGIGLWRVTGGVEKAPYDWAFNPSAGLSGTMQTVNGGVSVGFISTNASGSASWTGMTENFDTTYGSSNTSTHSGSSANNSGSTMGWSVSSGGSSALQAIVAVSLVPIGSQTDRYLRATGNWNGAVWSFRSNGPVGAPAPGVDESATISANFTVTLTENVSLYSVYASSGQINMAGYKITAETEFSLQNGATLDMSSGTIEVINGEDSPVAYLGTVVNPGTTIVTASNLLEDGGYIDFSNGSYGDLHLNLGIGGGGTVYNITGSPTFRSLIIQSKNSAAHTVVFDDFTSIYFDKFIGIGSSTGNRLIIKGQDDLDDNTVIFATRVIGGGSVYGQNLNMRVYYDNVDGPGGETHTPPYIGSNSIAGGNNWLLQDPPKISTLVDDFTEMSDDSEIDINWNKEVSGLGDISLSGSDGVIVFAFGANGVSRLMSKDTYDVVSQYLYIRGLSGQAGYAGIFVPYQDHPIGPWAPIEGPEDYRVGFTGTAVVVEKLNGAVWEFDSDYAVPDAYQGEELWRSVRVGARVSTSNPAQSLVIQSIGVGDEPPSSGNFLPFFMP